MVRRSRTGIPIDEINPEGNINWPTLPTFKQFLRQESELRLMILGPKFSDVIRDEANWRLKLYEKWLLMLEDGIGNDDTFRNSRNQMTQQERRKKLSQVRNARERNFKRMQDRERQNSRSRVPRRRQKLLDNEQMPKGLQSDEEDNK